MVDASPETTENHSDDDCYELIAESGAKPAEKQDEVVADREEKEHQESEMDDIRAFIGFTLNVFFFLSISNILLAVLIGFFPAYNRWYIAILFLINLSVAAYSIVKKSKKDIPQPEAPLRTLWLRNRAGYLQFEDADEDSNQDDGDVKPVSSYRFRLLDTHIAAALEGSKGVQRGDRIVSLGGLNVEGMCGHVLGEIFGRVKREVTVGVRYDLEHLEKREKKITVVALILSVPVIALIGYQFYWIAWFLEICLSAGGGSWGV